LLAESVTINKKIKILLIIIYLVQWFVFMPGFYSSDSIGIIEMIKNNLPNNNYTLNWFLYIKFFSLNGQYPGIPVFINFTLAYYAYSKLINQLFPGLVGNITLIIVALTPTLFATSLTLWRDIPGMIAIFLLLNWVLKLRNKEFNVKRNIFDILIIFIFIGFRPNLYVTALIFMFAIAFLKLISIYHFKIISIVILVSFLLSILITRVLIQDSYTNKFYSQEWMRNDISCFLAKNSYSSKFKDKFINIGGLENWKSKDACNFLNKAKFSQDNLQNSLNVIPNIWFDIFKENPIDVILIHNERNHYLLPIPILGLKEIPFIHSVIDKNEFGINWKNEEIAEIARLYIRMWNFASPILAHVGFWTLILIIFSFKNRDVKIISIFGISNILILYIFGPIPDARYGIHNLILGQSLLISYFVKKLKYKFFYKEISS